MNWYANCREDFEYWYENLNSRYPEYIQQFSLEWDFLTKYYKSDETTKFFWEWYESQQVTY